MKLKKFLYELAYGKVSKNFYINYQDTLHKINYTMVKTCYIVCILLTLILYLGGLFLDVIAPSRLTYLYYALVLCCLFPFLLITAKKNLRLVPLFYYTFAVLSFALAIAVGTIHNPESNAITFFLVLMVVPLLLIDRPICSYILAAAGTVAFCITSAIVKSAHPLVAEIDILEAVFSLPICLVFIYYNRNLYLKNLNSQIIFQVKAEIDKLTNVYNKVTTEQLCKSYFETKPVYENCALLMIDIDEFKNINDTFGHAQGDEVLRRFGGKLKDIFRETDIVGRFGGDEFLILAKNISTRKTVTDMSNRVIHEMNGILSDLTTKTFSCSIGICYSNKSNSSFQNLFSKADTALYMAKSRGKGRFTVFSDAAVLENDPRPLMVIADDVESIRAVLCNCFNDYKILQADNGKTVIDYLTEYHESIKVILLDLEMPIINGYNVLKYMLRNDDYRKIPVVVITSYGYEELKTLHLDQLEFIQKPFDPDAVKSIVSTVIAKKSL